MGMYGAAQAGFGPLVGEGEVPGALVPEEDEDAPGVDWGQQEKHFEGHNSYTAGRSTLTANPEELAQKAGTGTKFGIGIAEVRTVKTAFGGIRGIVPRVAEPRDPHL